MSKEKLQTMVRLFWGGGGIGKRHVLLDLCR